MNIKRFRQSITYCMYPRIITKLRQRIKECLAPRGKTAEEQSLEGPPEDTGWTNGVLQHSAIPTTHLMRDTRTILAMAPRHGDTFRKASEIRRTGVTIGSTPLICGETQLPW